MTAFDLDAAFASAADPQTARRSLERLMERRSGGFRFVPDQIMQVLPLLACQAPAGWLIARPRLIEWLCRTPFLQDEKPAIVFERELRSRMASAHDAAAFDRLLRLYRHREMARIALRDITRHAPLSTVVRELSHLADALVGAALTFWDRALSLRYGQPLGSGFCILAMGKYGAEELNYSSDIDVLFLLDEGGPARVEQALALARAVIKSLSAPTEHGFAFRVDANLRPYGRAGPLVQTLEEMERYYERAGQTWERAALIKARPCAGGVDLGRTLCERVAPFVYRRTFDLDAVTAIAEMKLRIDVAQAQSSRDDIKLGRGGIREIEFFVQAMQLLHGGRDRRLRVRSTLEALEALLHAGLLSAQDRDVLSEAYVFLRDVEHRLQIPTDQQTHSLPDPSDQAARLALSRRMGFSSLESFDSSLSRHRQAVASRFGQLFAAAADAAPARRDAMAVLAASEVDALRLSALTRLGFQDPASALDALQRLARQPESAFGARGSERHPGLAARLLDEMGRSPDPDLAMNHFARLTTSLANPAAVVSVLAASPAIVRRLMLLLASSEFLTHEFQLHPDLLEVVVRTQSDPPHRASESLSSELDSRIDAGAPIDAQLAALGQVRREEVLRIGLHDLAGRLTTVDAGRQLTQLAEAVVQRTLSWAQQEVTQRYGSPAEGSIAVLGFGSLGGASLDYGSDLDLVFIHDTRGATTGGVRGVIDAPEWAARVAQRLVSLLTLPGESGVLYQVDTRLRPSGTQGPIVASLESFANYHLGIPDVERSRAADLWERQALLRARPLAGDPGLCDRIAREVLEPAAQLPVPEDAGRRIHAMRVQLDAPEGSGTLSPKKGAGGLLDVDFIVQYFQLRHGLREPPTERALLDLIDRELVTRADGLELMRSYRLLRRVESRLRLVYGRPDVYVPASGPGLARLARQLGEMGPGASERLWAELVRTMRRTRELFERLVRD